MKPNRPCDQYRERASSDRPICWREADLPGVCGCHKIQGPRVLGLGTPLDRFSRYYETQEFRRHTSSDPEIRPSQLFFQLLVFAINLPPGRHFYFKK